MLRPFPKIFVSMDVTFLEGTSYYTDSYLQGIIIIKMGNWEFYPQFRFSQLHLISPHNTDRPTQVEENHNTKKNENRLKGLVNSKQHLAKKREGTISEHDQAPPQSLNPEVGDNTSIIPGKPDISIDELDLPIALRKNARSCTKHLLSNFVSYNNLSPSLYAFVTQLSGVVIPNNVHEALKVLQWKEAIFEEMKALEKNTTWEPVYLPNFNCPWLLILTGHCTSWM